MSLPAEFWYAYMNPPMIPIKPPVTIEGPLMLGFIPVDQSPLQKKEHSENYKPILCFDTKKIN